MLVLLRLLFVILMMMKVSAHPMCRDSSFPIKSELEHCQSYNGMENCCKRGDDHSATLNGISHMNDECRNMLMDASCATCDPWSAHLYGVEDASSPNRLTPRLCFSYCNQLFMTCGFKTLSSIKQWTNRSFSNSMESFCQAHGASDYCYSGVPFTLTSKTSKPSRNTNNNVHGGGDVVCIEKVLNDVENKKSITIVDYHHIHNDTILVGQQNGQVIMYHKNGSSSFRRVGVYLDIQHMIINHGERGLLGIALHRDFALNGRLFLSVSCRASAREYARQCTSDGDTAILEYIVSGRSMNRVASQSKYLMPQFKRIILMVKQPFPNHNGGEIMFSPSQQNDDNGNLYVFMGDGGGAGDPHGNSANLSSLLGKVLRININYDNSSHTGDGAYSIPLDNPFRGMDGGVREEIYAWGMRNPWRNSFDFYNSSRLFAGDVGQDHYEEIDIIVKGGNYGWNAKEGLHTVNKRAAAVEVSSIDPVIVYSHEDIDRKGAASIVGGYVYRGKQDKCLHGRYVFADMYNVLFTASASSWDVTTTQWKCALDSPIACSNALDEIYTFGQWRGAHADLLFSTSNGVYQFVNPERCSVSSNCNANI